MQQLNLSFNQTEFNSPATPQFGKATQQQEMNRKMQKPSKKISKSNPKKEKKESNKVYCQICNKSYTNKYSLHTHLKTLHKVKPHQCEVCSESFWEVKEHKTHMETFHLSYLVEQTKLQKNDDSIPQTKKEENLQDLIQACNLMKQSIQTQKTDLSISSGEDDDDLIIENHHQNNDKICLSQQLYKYKDEKECENEDKENIDVFQFQQNYENLSNQNNSNDTCSNNTISAEQREIQSIITQIQLPVLNPFNFELNF